MRLGVVILTTGGRCDQLAAALASIRAQRGISSQIVVVANTDDRDVDIDVGDAQLVRPGTNLGIPAGRNLGVSALADVDAVAFLDDDAELVDRDVLAHALAELATDEHLAVVSMRLIDPETGKTERRHVPRIIVGDPARSSWATTFLGGACVIRHSAYNAAGGLPERFFYAHEETSLAWRLIDQGWRIRYRGDLTVAHPAHPPTRHGDYHHLSARNRVLLARMHLPWPVAGVYLAVWLTLSLIRGAGGRRAVLRGFRDGFGLDGVERSPLRWATVVRLARYGRPPII